MEENKFERAELGDYSSVDNPEVRQELRQQNEINFISNHLTIDSKIDPKHALEEFVKRVKEALAKVF